MTTDLSWLADALRAEGCRVVEEGNWQARGRPGAFAPTGVLWHHTGSTSSQSNPFPTKDVLINGRPDLAGPLCHVGIGYDGVCHVIAAGRANHAGACNGFGPFTSAEDGNTQLVGFEIDYDGTQAMSAAQQDAATRCSTAVLARLGKDEGWAANHRETSTTGKWDTGGLSGDQIRKLIKDRLAGTGEDDDMPTYVHVKRTARAELDAGWHYIYWDDVITGDAVASVGSASIMIGGHLYSAVLTATVDSPGGESQTASAIRSRTEEGQLDASGAYYSTELNPSTEHPVTTGATDITNARLGNCNPGNRLRFAIYTPYDGSALVAAALTLFYW